MSIIKNNSQLIIF